MKPRWLPPLRHWLAGLAICLSGVAPGVRAGVDAYDFDYRISGDTSARPVQVFGDAARTYFQFIAGRPIPLILAGATGERVVPVREGPYHVVDGRSAEYTLRLAGRQARVEHAGRVWQAPSAASQADVSQPTAMKRGADDRTLSSYATPVRGDVIEWVDPEPREESRPATAREPAKVPAAQVRPAGRDTSSMGRPVRGNFDILLSDGTVATSLRRWARESGYRLEWNAPIEAPVVGDLTLDARPFPEAVGRIVTSLRASGYPLRMETPEGRVVRILHDPPR